MKYLKAALSAVAAIGIAGLIGPLSPFRFSDGHAPGLMAVAGGLIEVLFSPLSWLLVLPFFALFFVASRLGRKPLRVALFWIPTLVLSTWAVCIVSLATYFFLHLRHA